MYCKILMCNIVGMLLLAFTLPSLCYAEIFYQEDFEDDGKNWEFLGNVEVSDNKAHGGGKSVLVAEGTGLADSANFLIEMPDAEILYDVIWIYLD